MFKRDSPLRSSLRRKYSFTLPPKLPEGACLEVFRTHWNQAYAIIEKNGYVFSKILIEVCSFQLMFYNEGQHLLLTLEKKKRSPGRNLSRAYYSKKKAHLYLV